MDLGLNGKVVIVTGGGNGIGRAICLEMAREGAEVVVADLVLEQARQVVEEIKNLGGTAFGFALNVADGNAVHEMVKLSLQNFGTVDILVNSAGVISIHDVVDLPETEWDRVLTVNAKGTFLCCQAVLPHLIGQGKGKIINIASQAGKTGFPHESHYSASKGAVIAFTQALAREVACHGINVNAVCPGSIETEMNTIVAEGTARLLGISLEEKRAATINATPLRRKGTAEDVADMVVFLASDRASFMTGQAINITGGREMH